MMRRCTTSDWPGGACARGLDLALGTSIFASAPLALALAAVCASYIPARRAAAVPPVSELGAADRA
jgi:hypothetical protein